MSLETQFLGNSLSAWLCATATTLAISLVIGLAKKIIVRQLGVLAQRTSTRLDDAVVAVVQATRQSPVLMISIYLGSRWLQIPERSDQVVLGAAVVGAFLQVGFWAITLLDFFVSKSRQHSTNPGATTSLGALNFLGRITIWSATILMALDNLGVNVTALVASLGVGGIAVALAVQNILGDLFASLSIVIDKPFVVGDFIIVDDYMGTVEHVGLKTTRVRSLSGEQLVFSNSDLLKARLRNYKRMSERRAVFSFGVLYSTTVEQLERIPATVRKIVESLPMTRFDRAHFKDFGDSSLNFEVVYWMLDPDFNQYMDTQQQINLQLLSAFRRDGIGFAFPTQTLDLQESLRIETTGRRSADFRFIAEHSE